MEGLSDAGSTPASSIDLGISWNHDFDSIGIPFLLLLYIFSLRLIIVIRSLIHIDKSL